MQRFRRPRNAAWLVLAITALVLAMAYLRDTPDSAAPTSEVTARRAVRQDVSPPLGADPDDAEAEEAEYDLPLAADYVAPPVPARAAEIEQTTPGTKPAATLIASFDGLGVGFNGPQGSGRAGGNPSDNGLAVGPDHIVQVVNSRMAIFTKKGKKYDETGRVLYGSVPHNNIFRGFGGTCEEINNGDTVVRYDQLADRWLVVMPIFRRIAYREDQKQGTQPEDPAAVSVIGRPNQPGAAAPVYQPPPPPPDTTTPGQPQRGRGAGGPPAGRGAQPTGPQGGYAMCYAISTSSDPLGSYYRYEFLRPYFPDYPRPAIWNDGYYNPTSTGDNAISETIRTQKHACVVEREKMLKGQPASEQCVIMHNVGFLNNADVDGKNLPPSGAPNIMMAAGGTQLDSIFADSIIDVWQFHVDWKDPSKTKITGPTKIPVAPYHYLCNGQLTRCVPQPGTGQKVDAQGDKIMSRLVYRRIGNTESIVGVHSVNTSTGGGGVRWYEFRVGRDRAVTLRQQGTYMSDGLYRWMASPAIDRFGNIGIGYSFGGGENFIGQRFAGRQPNDPLGQLTFAETILVAGEDAQKGDAETNFRNLRWEDYTTTAVDPSDDCTIWYVGDYVKRGATTYSTKIGGFRMPGCR